MSLEPLGGATVVWFRVIQVRCEGRIQIGGIDKDGAHRRAVAASCFGRLARAGRGGRSGERG